MESTQLLDLLGNENRRNIIQLLASRPYYVSEISERLGVGPKAILGHLEQLEQTGLIRANTNEQRRKYYHITENLKLEVFVSPYSYTVEICTVLQKPQSEKPKSPHRGPMDDSKSIETLKKLNTKLFELESRRRQLADQQHKIEGEMTDVMAECVNLVHRVAENYPKEEILMAVLKKPQDIRSLSMCMELPEYFMEQHIQSLMDRGIINERQINNRQLLTLI
jgi:ArsR family transcriptional regulator